MRKNQVTLYALIGLIITILYICILTYARLNIAYTRISHACKHSHTHTHIHTQTHKYTYTQTYTHIHTNTHIHAHNTHTRARSHTYRPIHNKHAQILKHANAYGLTRDITI